MTFLLKLALSRKSLTSILLPQRILNFLLGHLISMHAPQQRATPSINIIMLTSNTKDSIALQYGTQSTSHLKSINADKILPCCRPFRPSYPFSALCSATTVKPSRHNAFKCRSEMRLLTCFPTSIRANTLVDHKTKNVKRCYSTCMASRSVAIQGRRHSLRIRGLAEKR